MVMEGSQAKNPASEESETDHLEDHRRRLGHEQSTDHREQQVQVHEQAQRAQSGADRERAGVTHDDARGPASIRFPGRPTANASPSAPAAIPTSAPAIPRRSMSSTWPTCMSKSCSHPPAPAVTPSGRPMERRLPTPPQMASRSSTTPTDRKSTRLNSS